MNPAILGAKLAAAGLRALGQELVGPSGSAVLRRVADTIGVEPHPDTIARAMVHDPQAEIALRQLDVELEQERRSTYETVVAADERNLAFQEANVREARLSPNLDPMRERMAYVLLATLILSLAGVMLIEVIADVPDMVLGLAIGVVGGFATIFQQMAGYFFGTSSGSSAKERIAAVERMDKQ